MSTKKRPRSTSSLQPPTTDRVSIYSIREKLLLKKMTQVMVKLTPDAETHVIHRFHDEIPDIQLDSHLTYCLYITVQNLIHLNVIHILLYHAIFWLNSVEYKNERLLFTERIQTTEYEKTFFIATKYNRDGIIRPTINIHLINKYVYITLIGVGSIELIAGFLWTLQKKLSVLIQRNQKWRNRLRLLLIGIIIILYCLFIAWIFFHTFITQNLTVIIFLVVSVHFILLTLLDKPNLFCDTSIDLSKGPLSTANIPRKRHRHSTSSLSMSSSSSSITINPTSRLSYRLSTSMHSRKVNSLYSSLTSSVRWISVAEQNSDVHECSTVYAVIKQEADNLWAMFVRRMSLKFYRTFSSFIFFDLIPLTMMDTKLHPSDNQRYKILIVIFALNTFLTHSVFLFPTKFQGNLHRVSAHFSQWYSKPFIRPDANNKLSSQNTEQINNRKYPQPISYSILYRLFGDITSFLSLQFIICLILICCQFFWIIRGKFGFESLISVLIILSSSYTIFKIIRNRLVFVLIDEYESDEVLLTSKHDKSN